MNNEQDDDFVVSSKIPPENSEAVERNKAWIENVYKTHFEKEDTQGVPAWRKHNADVFDRIKFVDEEDDEDPKVREKSEQTIWEIAKNEVLRERAFDFSFMKLKKEDRLKLLRADLSDSVAKTSLGVVGVSSVIDQKINSKTTAEKMADANAALFIKSLDRYLSDKGEEKARVSQSSVLGAAINESEVAESFISYIENKRYSQNVTSSFKKDSAIFNEKMKSFWGNLWTQSKEYVANNRTRLVVDTAATLVVALSPVSYAAVGAYAAYAAVGSFVWPIVEKRRKAIRQAKKAGRNYDDYKLGLKFNGLRKAWKDIKSDQKEYKRYKNRAKTGAAAGVLIAGGLGILGTGLVTNVSAMAAKVGGTITRSLASVTSQGLNYIDTKKDLRHNDNAVNRAAHKNAKWGLGIGLTIAALSSYFGISRILESASEAKELPIATSEHNPDPLPKAASIAVPTSPSDELPTLEADVSESVTAPAEWSKDSGVGQDVWADTHGGVDSKGNMRVGKVTGILSRTNAGFDKWNAEQIAKYGDAAVEKLVVADAKATVGEIYQNIANARAANPELFGDMNDQQVFVAYVKLVEQTEKVMNGPKIEINGKMVPTLISKIDKDGLPMYNNEYVDGKLVDHNSNMKKLFMLIRCGKKVDISPEDVRAELGRIDLKTGRGIGAAFNVGVTNNVMVGEQGCQGVSIWRKGINAIKNIVKGKDAEVRSVKTVEIPREDVVVSSVSTLQPVDAEVRSVQVRELEVSDAEVQSVHTTPKAVIGRGTSDIHDNDLTDKVAQSGKTVGESVDIKGSGRKLEGAEWMKANLKNNGGRSM